MKERKHPLKDQFDDLLLGRSTQAVLDNIPKSPFADFTEMQRINIGHIDQFIGFSYSYNFDIEIEGDNLYITDKSASIGRVLYMPIQREMTSYYPDRKFPVIHMNIGAMYPLLQFPSYANEHEEPEATYALINFIGDNIVRLSMSYSINRKSLGSSVNSKITSVCLCTVRDDGSLSIPNVMFYHEV